MIRDMLPERCSLLLVGPPGVGKLEYFVDLAKDFLAAGDSVVFLTIESPPEDLRTAFRRAGVDPAVHEGKNLILMDGFSGSLGRVGSPGDHTISLSSLSNLEQIGMGMAKAAGRLSPPVRVFFHTLSPLFFHNAAQAVVKFFQIVGTQIRMDYGFGAFALHEGVHEPSIVRTLAMFTDGVVEMRFTEDVRREMRIHHFRGVDVSPRWHGFRVAETFELDADVRLLEERLVAGSPFGGGIGRSVLEP